MPTTNGKEQVFNFGIKNNDERPADTTADFLASVNADGTQGKIDPVDLPISDAVQVELDKLPKDYTNTVYVNDNDPNSATIFSLDNPPLTNDDLLKADVSNLYIGLNLSTWVYNSTTLNYVTEVVSQDTSNFLFPGTSINAGNNTSSAISRTGSVEAKSFIKTGSTQDSFLMGNGSDKKIDLDKIINLAPHAFASNFLENKNIEKSISLNTRRNIFVNSETYTTGNFVSVGTGMTVDNADTFLHNGVKLARFKGTAYQSNISLRQSILTAGKRYILSFYVKNNNPQTTTNRFIWFNTLGTSSSGQAARFVDNNVRRVSYMFQAAGAQGVYVNNVPTEPIGTGVTGFLTLGVSKTTVAPFVDLYIGGFQIEEVSNTYVDGVVWMGDSTIQSNSGSINAHNSVAIPRFFEGVFNCTSYNVAVAGETMAQMDARWATSVTPLKPNSKYVVIQGGINDISQGRSLSDMQASLNSMNTKALADGFIPVFLTCTPNGSFSVSQETLRNDYNLWLKTNFKKVIDINTIAEQEGKLMTATPNSLFEGDGTHYGVSLKKAIAEFMAKSGFFEFLQPTDYQATTASYTGKDLSVKSAKVADLTISTVPPTSAGTYDFVSINGTTGVIEKIPSANVATSASVLLKADLASPALTGTPTAPTATIGTNTAQLATTALVKASATLDNVLTNGFTATAGKGVVLEGVVSTDKIVLSSAGITLGDYATNTLAGLEKDKLSFTDTGVVVFDLNLASETIRLKDGTLDFSEITSPVTLTAQDKSGKIALTLGSFTVSSLPTPTGTAYAEVTDALAPTYMTTIVGGGSVVCPVFYNGTDWVAH